MFGFLKRGKTSEPVKRIHLFEHELFSCHQQQSTPPNLPINTSSFHLKWNMSHLVEDMWREIFFLPLLMCLDHAASARTHKAAGQESGTYL